MCVTHLLASPVEHFGCQGLLTHLHMALFLNYVALRGSAGIMWPEKLVLMLLHAQLHIKFQRRNSFSSVTVVA